MIRLCDHQIHWSDQFQQEARRISEILGDIVVCIHHIGSTAIPAIKAKPVIDMLLEVPSLAALDHHTASLQGLGYEAKGEFGLAGRRYFRKDDVQGNRTHQLHAYVAATASVRRHLAFRDELRDHPELARQYDQLKQELAQLHARDPAAYSQGKSAFIVHCERRALNRRKPEPGP